MDFASVLSEAKKSFTKDKKSAITEALKNNPNSIYKAEIEKAKGLTLRFYYLDKNGARQYSDYCAKNGAIVEASAKEKGFKILTKKDLS